MKHLKTILFFAAIATLIGCNNGETAIETSKTDPSATMSDQQKAMKDGLGSTGMPDAAKRAAGGK